MASSEDLVEMRKGLTENPDNALDGSASKAEENRARLSDVEKDENGSVVENKRVVVETEPVVGSVLDVDSGLVDTKKDEQDVLSSAIIANAVVRDDVEKVAKNVKEQRVINGEEMEDSNVVFGVGDLVWGKIKSHPWWPGQIYDSKDASAFALKHSQEGRLLVAYFGDGSCSWCLPSQLVPFVDNFEQMSMDSSLKSLMNAIQSAVDEIGRLVEYNMLCKCIPSDKKAGLARPVVSNAGVKKGVLVPDVDIRRLSVPKFEPAKIVEKLMSYAKGMDDDSLLEVAVLKSWLSAFYCLRGGGYRLTEYCEPIFIEGLEDKNETVTASAGDFSVPIEVPMLSPDLEDDWLNSPAVKSQASSDDIIYHRRRQKSVAEIMKESEYGVIESKSQKGAKVKGENASFGGKRRQSDATEKSVDGVEKGQLSGKLNEIKVDVAENVSGEGSGEIEKISSPRERKKSKYLSPPYTNHAWIKENWGFDKSTKIERSTSPPISEEELPIAKPKMVDVSGQRVENEKKLTFSASDVNVQVNELVSGVKLAAVNPLCLSKNGSLDTVWAFVSALRSSTYLHGTDYKTYRKFRKGRKKRKSLKSQEDDFKTPKAAKTEGETKPCKSKYKKYSEFSFAKSCVDKSKENVSTCLILTFSPGFTLPSKEEILELFSKFGSLNEKETNVLTESHSVRIVYTTDLDAEAAFKSSITESPFGVENVNYWLQRSSDGSKARPKNSKRAFEDLGSSQEMSESMSDVRVIKQKLQCSSDGSKACPKNTNQAAEDLGSSQEMSECMSDVRVIKQKLEIMTAILENYHSKFSTEEKMSLKDEMKQLMENVEMVTEKVRIAAEKRLLEEI